MHALSLTLLEATMSRIEQLKADLLLEEQRLRDTQRERAVAYNLNPIQNVITYEIAVHKEGRPLERLFRSRKTELIDPEYSKEQIVITKTWVNRDEVMAKMKEEGFSLTNFPDEAVTSVTYFLYHSVLLHDGGGWLLLKTPSLVSAEQWGKLVSGEIPAELLAPNEPYKPWC